MKKKSIGFIIGLMGFALLGVMSMQLYFLQQSYHMQSDLFDRSVNDALNNVVNKLAKQDAINFLNKKAQYFDDQLRPGENHRTFVSTFESGRTSVSQPEKRKLTTRERRLNLLRDSLKKVILSNQLDEEFFNMAQSGELNLHFRYEEYTDEFGNIHQRMIDPKIISGPANPAVKKNRSNLTSMIRFWLTTWTRNMASRSYPLFR